MFVVVVTFVASEISGIVMVTIVQPQLLFILKKKRAYGVNGGWLIIIRGVWKLIFDPWALSAKSCTNRKYLNAGLIF